MQSWGGAHEACVEFLDRWADEAAGLDWTTLELFGVHPEVGTIRPDFCGAMMLSAERVSAITDKHMRFGNMAFYRDKPGPPAAQCRCGCSAGDGGPLRAISAAWLNPTTGPQLFRRIPSLRRMSLPRSMPLWLDPTTTALMFGDGYRITSPRP